MGMGRATGSVESDARTDFFLDRASGGVHRLAGELLFGEAERLHANTNGRVLSVISVTFDVDIATAIKRGVIDVTSPLHSLTFEGVLSAIA